MGTKSKIKASKDFINHISGSLPKFADIFDEESFYLFAFFFVILVIIGAVVASRYIKINDPDEKRLHFKRK